MIDEATVALAGEMLGGMTEAFDRTLALPEERKQFGVAIGSFQALKHRAARLFIELELSRSAVMAAARALDEQQRRRAAAGLARQGAAVRRLLPVANEAVQMHGGIGMTDEHDIGFFLKRARAARDDVRRRRLPSRSLRRASAVTEQVATGGRPGLLRFALSEIRTDRRSCPRSP